MAKMKLFKEFYRTNMYSHVDEWGEDVEYMAELTLVLNWKIWDLYHTKEELARLYDEMWRKHDEYCRRTFKGEDAQIYFKITD